jgi:transcriptional regulator with XRE-family HTH domain
VTLADVRQQAGYSQAALAARLGLPPSTVSSIERGRHHPGDSATRWRQELGLSAKEFDRLWRESHHRFRSNAD